VVGGISLTTTAATLVKLAHLPDCISKVAQCNNLKKERYVNVYVKNSEIERYEYKPVSNKWGRHYLKQNDTPNAHSSNEIQHGLMGSSKKVFS
jgi:hypothetical protein